MPYPYFDVFESNIQHHEERVRYWMEQGKPDYAAGSKSKADRWRSKRDALNNALKPKLPDGPLFELLEAKLKEVERKLSEELEHAVFLNGRQRIFNSL
jgi:hypothetical protein